MKLKCDILFCFILIFYLILNHSLLGQLKTLPSPVYGGDLYFQHGSIIHIMEGGSPLHAPNILGSQPAYFISYSALVAIFGLIFNLTAMQAMFIFSQILLIVSFSVFYILATKFFKNKLIAILSLLIYIPLNMFPIFKYTDFTYVLITPIFFFSLFHFLRKRDLKSSLILGIVAGIMGISHGAAFFVTNLTFVIIFLYYVFLRYISFDIGKLRLTIKFENFLSNFIYALKLMLPVFLVSFLISLLWWYEPIFVYHGKTLNDSQIWSFPDISKISYQFNYLFSTIRKYFFNFSSITTALVSIFSLLGLYFVFKKGNRFKNIFIKLLILISIIACFHYFITEPLLSIHFVPHRMEGFTFPFTISLLACFGLKELVNLNNKKHLYAFLLIILVILSANIIDFLNKVENDVWINAGKRSLPQELTAAQEWILNNTDVNDVFLSTNELSFALNSLTGRKVVITRRAHNSPFINIEQREADGAVMLYGNDSEKIAKLLKKYNIKYLYWSYYWIQSEYTIKDNEIINYFDPILVKENQEMHEYFDKHGVNYIKINGWIDPAMRGEDFKKYDLLLVLPNYENFTHPWSHSLDKYLKLVWNYTVENQTLAKIYKIIL